MLKKIMATLLIILILTSTPTLAKLEYVNSNLAREDKTFEYYFNNPNTVSSLLSSGQLSLSSYYEILSTGVKIQKTSTSDWSLYFTLTPQLFYKEEYIKELHIIITAQNTGCYDYDISIAVTLGSTTYYNQILESYNECSKFWTTENTCQSAGLLYPTRRMNTYYLMITRDQVTLKINNDFTKTKTVSTPNLKLEKITVTPKCSGIIQQIKITPIPDTKALFKIIIKQPQIIELKNSDTETINYKEYTHTLTIHNPNSFDLTEHQIKITITGETVGDQFYWGKEGSIRLHDASGNELPYWVEEWDAENKKAVIWTKLPLIPAEGSVQLTLKSSLVYADKSDGSAVFDFYDDFNTKDINKWNWPSDWIVEYGYLKQTYSSGWPPSGSIWSIKPLSISITNNYGVVIEAYTRNLGTVHAYDIYILWDDDTDHTYAYGVVVAVGSYDRWHIGSTSTTWVDWKEPDTRFWHLYQVIILNGNWKLLVDGKQYSSYAGSISQLEAIGLRSKGQSYWEWVRVRKYAEQEPTVTFSS